ncbi:MAG: class I SAM-dependent methyltransferase [Pyrinomonadaceae bacterium]
MSKTEKELAFINDLFVGSDWTKRFADLVDKHIKFADKGKLLYYNSGSGTHALRLRDKFGSDAEIYAVSETPELQKIAQAKLDVIDADENRAETRYAEINFVNASPDKKFDAVLADASFVRPKDLPEFVEKMADFSAGQVAIFLPTTGSFGEIFSFMWETLLNTDLLEHSPQIENLIAELPTAWQAEEILKNAGLKHVKSFTENEIFEFETGEEFIKAPLLEDFLLPVWLRFLNEEEKERVKEKLAQTVDNEDGTLTFRFSIKATLIVGEKN